MLCQICYMTPIQKFHFEMLLFALQYTKKHFKQKRFLESAPGKNVLFDFLKLKMKINYKNWFFLCPSQKPFSQFWGPKIKCLTFFDFEFSFGECFLM